MKTHGKILSKNLFPVIGIGASAGGLDAFRKVLRAIPEKSGMAYVLVQHLAPTHESLLPELLQKVTAIPVSEITDDVKIEPDHIYVLPSNKMLVANDGVLQLSPRSTKKNELNLPIDLFFTSLAEIHQSHAIGIVLSGTGSDGTEGLKAIKENDGLTFAQDEASAAYDGMPKSAVQAGVVDFVLPPEQMPNKLVEITRILGENGADDPTAPEPKKDAFKQILSVLRVRKGTDFTYYKQTTIRRRILRRMAINKTEKPADYLTYLRDHKPEQDALYQDLLIPVTSFFRDQPVFDHLCETVFPLIMKNKPVGEPVRIWVAGCSTGQEAYSIAMCLKEFLGDQPERVQIFASDLSEPAIAKARTGIYAKNEVADVSPQRLQEFFTRSSGSYHVNKSIRDMCVFTAHNFLKDPPFGKLDFISCRNVLIYMESYLQKKAFSTFHYALNPTGFLLLGKSETIGNMPDLFVLAAKTSKLFTRKDGPSRFMSESVQRSKLPINRATPTTETLSTDFQKIADELILSYYTPAGVVVNASHDIVHFRGITTPYLAQASGKPTHNVLLMAKYGLAFELRNLLHKVKKEQAAVIKENISLEVNGSLQTISIEALPLPNMVEPHYLILFHPATSRGATPSAIDPQEAKKSTKKDNKDLRIAQLERELAQAREDMRSITQDQEAVNEELQSANEELLSGSEELQSLNEELETGKEELQSTNEELTVVNQEIISLNEQVTAARNYAEAIVSTIREPLLVLDASLRVRTANAAFYKTFQVNERETEEVFLYELGNAQWKIPELRRLLEKILPEKSTFIDFEMTHLFPTIGERIMQLSAREILSETNAERLILLSIEDITAATKAHQAERQAQERVQFIADAMPEKVWTAGADGNVDYFNQAWFTYTGLSFEELKDWGWQKIIHPDDWNENKRRWQHSIRTGDEFGLEHRFLNGDGAYRWHLSRGIAQKNEHGQVIMWIGTNTEIHEQKTQNEALEQAVAARTHELQKANETLQHMNKELESFNYVSSHDLQEPLRKIQTLAGRILDKEHQNLTSSGKDYFGRIQKAAERMQQLIHDLLTFSRLSTGEWAVEITDLSGLVQEVISELSETIAEKNATINAAGLGTTPVIVFQFRQLLHNLIGNALKFSNPGVPPHITIKSRTIKGGKLKNGTLLPEKAYCHLTITDNGIGFEDKYGEKIFEVFQRLHTKAQYPGTGIGLAIVRKIVTNHNGIVTATGKLNNGARFDIYLPAA